MFINPKHAIEQGWIQFPESSSPEKLLKKCVQPNAIDFTLDHLFTVDVGDGVATITEDKDEKVMLPNTKMNPNKEGFVRMLPGKLYDGMSDFYVDVPDGIVCDLIIRSTFNRVGLQLGNGLYDTGFKGNIGFTLFNRGPSIVQTRLGTRIAQIMFFDADSYGKYAGGYNTEKGEHWSDKTS